MYSLKSSLAMATEELVHMAIIYKSIAGSLISSLLENLSPVEE